MVGIIRVLIHFYIFLSYILGEGLLMENRMDVCFFGFFIFFFTILVVNNFFIPDKIKIKYHPFTKQLFFAP